MLLVLCSSLVASRIAYLKRVDPALWRQVEILAIDWPQRTVWTTVTHTSSASYSHRPATEDGVDHCNTHIISIIQPRTFRGKENILSGAFCGVDKYTLKLIF